MKLRKAIYVFLGMLSMQASADRLYFNDLSTPKSLADLRAIQEAMQSNLSRAREATVCLQIGEGSGSGVIVSPEGLVLTAAHVTGGVGEEVKVVMEDGTEYQGVSLGLNAKTDAAMLKITDSGPFPFVEYDKVDATKLGDWVFSLGHSGGFDKARGINVRIGRLVREAETTIQSDCMLIGGDSGGPLFDMTGKVIGIHSRVGASKEESMHVPLREFQAHWEELEKSDFVGEGPFAKKTVPGSGFLGMLVEDDLEKKGLRVTELWEKGPAENAGIKVGDLIVEVEGEKATQELLKSTLGQLGSGQKISIKWTDGEETKEKELKLGDRP